MVKSDKKMKKMSALNTLRLFFLVSSIGCLTAAGGLNKEVRDFKEMDPKSENYQEVANYIRNKSMIATITSALSLSGFACSCMHDNLIKEHDEYMKEMGL